MAEIQTKDRNSRRRNIAPRVDLTPMVDLGFLLITFFMLTTTLSKGKRLVINMPYQPQPVESPTKFIDTSTLTIIPVSKHRVAYYHGAFTNDVAIEVIPIHQLRGIITQKQSNLKRLPDSYSNNARKIQVLIKPDSSSQYQDLVNTLDEMLINNVTIYAIVDLADAEVQAINRVM